MRIGRVPRYTRCRAFIFLSVWACSSLLGVCGAAPQPAHIPEAEIEALREELDQGIQNASLVEARRACKGVVRDAKALIEAAPDAPNRFSVLDIIFQGQKQLLRLENTVPSMPTAWRSTA